MARIRTIKPEFFTSEDIVYRTPRARLLYIALWCECDREGRMQWKPGTFKRRYFPEDDCDINELCKELTDAGLVRLYGDGLAHVPSFSRHQQVNPRETASVLPDPGQREKHASARVSDAQTGREGKGKEGNDLPPIGGCPPTADQTQKPGEKGYQTPDCPHQAIVDLYHESLPFLPRVEVWNDLRQGFLRQRWREVCADQKYTVAEGVEWFRDFFQIVGKSQFLTGKSKPKPGDRPFLADLEWLIRPSNFVKVIEGKYQ